MADHAPSPLHIKFYIIKRIFDLLATLVRAAGAIIIVYIFMEGLKSIAAQSPDSVAAIAKVIEALKLNEWLPWVVSAILGTATYFERRGKKRAIKEKGRLQKIVEGKDPNRTSCGLTEFGDTPEE